MMKHTLSDENTAAIAVLKRANEEFGKLYPGDSGARQPVHVLYGGAHLFRAESTASLGRNAMAVLEEYGSDAVDFEDGVVRERVAAKLRMEPVEDYRIDFEDGYGYRTDAAEDGDAERTANEVARGLEIGSLPPFIGIRVKPLTEALRARSIRTLDIFLTTLLDRTRGCLPRGFVVTLPKITIPDQPAALVSILDVFESSYSLPVNSIRVELMIETTQAIVTPSGQIGIPALIDAAGGRCRGIHFGPFDYTAVCDITSSHQKLTHPACDFARHMMLVCAAQRGVAVADGPTNVLPIPPHRGDTLTGAQQAENRVVVHNAWRLHASHIRHALINGFYQGWDLHPAQLPSRYAAVYSFFREGLEATTVRLKNFLDKAAQATLVGEVFDDAATGQGLLNYFLRGLGCGALSEPDVIAAGLTIDELRTRSFHSIVEGRRVKAD
ncbi:MAG TPA: hypothetical protein VKU01_00825 [Bryobacteraceae bacterium]|nr:hypothetical protein [Bryobacteraceae bacterium]